LLARRLAPCTPLHATSPTTCNPATDVRPMHRRRRRPCGSARRASPGSPAIAGRCHAPGTSRTRSGMHPASRLRHCVHRARAGALSAAPARLAAPPRHARPGRRADARLGVHHCAHSSCSQSLRVSRAKPSAR
jgi:hypothetical protein